MGVSSARVLSVLLQALVFANAISGKKAFRNAERLLLCLCACAVEMPKAFCLIESVHVALRLHGNKQVSQQQHFFIATLQATFSAQKPFGACCVALQWQQVGNSRKQRNFFIATLQATFFVQKPFWRFVLRCSGNKKMVHVTSKISVSSCKLQKLVVFCKAFWVVQFLCVTFVRSGLQNFSQ